MAPGVQEPGHPPVRVGEEFSLAPGESARIRDTDLVLIFDAVTEDSRCPANVVCIWEGNARAQFTLRQYDALDERTMEVHDDSIELNTSSRFPRGRIVLVGLSRSNLVMRSLGPQPPVTDPKSYVATLLIEPQS